jgi:hypothetical protein
MRNQKRTCAGRRARALRWTATPTTRRPSLLRSLPALAPLAFFTPCAQLLAGSTTPNGRRLRPDRLRLAQGLHRSLALLHLTLPSLRSLRPLGSFVRSVAPLHRAPTPATHPAPSARAPAGEIGRGFDCTKENQITATRKNALDVISLSGQVREDGRARRRRSATWPCCVCATLTTPPPSETAL